MVGRERIRGNCVLTADCVKGIRFKSEIES